MGATFRLLRVADVTLTVLAEVGDERARQDAKWGKQRGYPDGTGWARDRIAAAEARAECDRAFTDGRGTWRHVLLEEVFEALAESDRARLRAELVQVAAVAVAWVESLGEFTEGEES